MKISTLNSNYPHNIMLDNLKSENKLTLKKAVGEKRSDSASGTTGLLGAAIWIEIHVTNRLRQAQAELDDGAGVRVDDVDKVGVRSV